MRKVLVNTFVTLDGVMQAPGGSDEDVEGGFPFGGWQMPYFDEAMGQAVSEAYASSGGMLLGRVTYDIFAAYWPNATGEGAEYAPMMNEPPKYVASTTLKAPLAWQNSHLLEGDLGEAVTKLKQEDAGDLQVIGSSKLAQSLAQLGLVDGYRLMIHPVVLGTGKRLFADGGPRMNLKLTDHSTSSTGVLILEYAPE